MTGVARPFAALVAVALAGCTGASEPARTPPTVSESLSDAPSVSPPESPSESPAGAPAVPQPVADALSEVGRGEAPLTSVAVVHQGRLLGDAYAPGLQPGGPQPVWSVTKSVVSLLVGIAIDEGLIRRDTPLAELLGDAAAAHPEVTVEHVLTMTSGLDLPETEATFRSLYTSDDWVGSVLGRPAAHPPGERFAYCSPCVHLLTAALDRVTGGLDAWADERLFGPLGFEDVVWERANDGTGVPVGGWGLELTARQLAALGRLVLAEGELAGRRLVSAAWVEQATGPRVPVGEPFEGWQVGYGYLWWVHGTGAYAATGRGGQLIVVVPGSDLVVAATADLSDEEAVRAFAFVWTRIVAAVPLS